ncbi:MAG: hypothetical protein H8E15_08235 [Planctomycetes bacterium]|nr:hypothetical protein [Planctomycetota bacterium]
MRFSLLLPLLFAACQTPAPEPQEKIESPQPVATFEQQLAKNHATWMEQAPALIQDQPGDWVLIADGAVQGTWSDADSAWEQAQALPEKWLHAYLYRAGIDDVEITFQLSPFTSQRPHWVQLGRQIRMPWKLTIAAVDNTWYRDDKKVSWGSMEAQLQLENASGSKQHRVQAVASNMFLHDLTLRAADAQALGLGRITAPLQAFYGDASRPCEKVVLRLRIPELDIDEIAVAFVFREADTPSELQESLDGLIIEQQNLVDVHAFVGTVPQHD